MKSTSVINTTVGFMGGNVDNPTYSQVKTGTTGHLECVEVEYDSDKTSYENLVTLFFETHQQYYEHKRMQPYCHSYKKIF